MKEQRSYQADAYIWQFTASLQQVRLEGNALWVALDHSYFYPEGGGQPSDFGWLGDYAVVDVQWVDDRTWHRLEGTIEKDHPHPLQGLPPGHPIACQVDGQRRLDLMCQHSGQHVLSAILSHQANTATIGFHLTSDNLTIDTDTVLDTETWIAIELACNEILRSCLPFLAHYPSLETLHQFELRKQPKVAEGIRLVSLGELDTVPCGGTHVRHTGELGLIKILRVDKYKAGQRVYFAVGQRAIAQMQLEASAVRALAAKLSTPVERLEEAANRLNERLSLALLENQRLMKQLAEQEAQRLIEAHTALADSVARPVPIALWDEDRDPELIKALISALCSQSSYQGAILVGYKDDKGAQFVLRAPIHGDAAKLLSEAKAHYALKGGGNAQRIQAGGQDPVEVRRAYEWLLTAITAPHHPDPSSES